MRGGKPMQQDMIRPGLGRPAVRECRTDASRLDKMDTSWPTNPPAKKHGRSLRST